jgi:hypothetical protein
MERGTEVCDEKNETHFQCRPVSLKAKSTFGMISSQFVFAVLVASCVLARSSWEAPEADYTVQ